MPRFVGLSAQHRTLVVVQHFGVAEVFLDAAATWAFCLVLKQIHNGEDSQDGAGDLSSRGLYLLV